MKNSSIDAFTLIELVMVIVILGILAAFAIPRFTDISGDARASTIKSLEGSLRSAATLAKTTSLTGGLGVNDSIQMEGQAVTMSNRFPTADTAGISSTQQSLDGFTDDGAGKYTLASAPTPANCSVTYSASVGGSPPIIATDTSGC